MSDDVSHLCNGSSTSGTESNLLIDPKDVICPVCKEALVFPRSYDCGHVVCELCMCEMDARDISEDTHSMVVHHCPVCRYPTLKSWNIRPRCIAMESIAASHPEFEERKAEVLPKIQEYRSNLCIAPRDIDLATVSYFSRAKLALDLYEIILDRLYIAALEGLEFVSITEPDIVKNIEKVVDILSRRLFLRHNVYKILVTRAECTIYLSKNAFNWRRQHENPSWDDPAPPATPIGRSLVSAIMRLRTQETAEGPSERPSEGPSERPSEPTES